LTDIATEIAPAGFGMSPKDLKNVSIDIANKIGVNGPSSEQTIEQWKSTLTEDQLDNWEDQVDDYIKKDIKSRALPLIRIGNREIVGDADTTKQFSDLKEQGFWGGAILGVAKSLPAMIGGAGPAGWAQRTAQMYAQISDGLAVEMENNPEFANITENEKLAITLPIGIVSATLEAYGLRNVMASKGVINSITMSVLGKAGVGTSARTFRELVENEVESKIARGLLIITAAGVAEFETGAAQELTETGFKALYNEIKDKGMFETPDSVTDLIENVAVAGAQEAIGGFVLGVPSGISAAYSKKGFLKIDDTSFETFANMANDEKMQSAYISNLKQKITQGIITEKEAKEQLNNYRNSAGLYRQLPEGLTTQQKKEDMNLLKEKRDLENYVNGKDNSLVVKQKNRITEINDSLTKLTKEDAVQEPTTDESVLRTEQPEMELQGVVEGNAKPEGLTTEKEITNAKPKGLEPNGEVDSNVDRFETYSGNKFEITLTNVDETGQPLPRGEGKKKIMIKTIDSDGNVRVNNALTKTFETAAEAKEYANKFIEKDTVRTEEETITTKKPEEVDNRTISERQAEAESKIKRKDLFIGVGDFSTELGGSDKAAVPVSHNENNGIEIVEYAHPNTGSIDVVVTGKSENDFVGFYRIYENGKPINKWSSIFENQSRNKEDFKTMISGAQGLLPEGHEYTEKTSISTDGLRVWNQQLGKGYELQYDENGNIKTNSVAINGDAIVNELGIDVNKGGFKNIKVTNSKDFNTVKNALLPYLEKFGLNESNIRNINGTVKIDLPVLKQSKKTEVAPTEVAPTEVAPESQPTATEKPIDLEQIIKNLYRDKVSSNIIEKVGNNWIVKTEVEGKELFKSKTLKGAKEFISNDNQESLRVKPTEVAPTEVKPIDAAIKTLQESKEYIEADDIQKESLVRATRKRFGLKEKSAPSVNRLFGKLKDIAKITMTEKVALAKQLRDKARGARESVSAFRKASQEVAKEIKELKEKGTITATQAANIISKFSKVNLLNEKSISNFVDYMAKVFSDANYAKNISEIKKLQRQAKSRNHTSMTNVVREFTSINPELIPLDRLQDYIKALDFLNTRTPSYSNMNDILSEINSYKEVDEFDAVKTMDSLEKKYEKIELNNLKSVEEYVSLIRDINSFKRKAYQLLQEDAITQEEYDDLINRVGNDQAAVEKKYEKEISQLKKNLINEIKKQRPKRNSDFSNEENNLIKKYLTLSDSDLKSLSPEDLFILNDILENISNGEIDYYRFNDVISKAFTNDGVNQLAKQIEGSKFNMSSERGRQELSEQESAFWEGLLGMGRSKAGALQKFVISTFNRAIGSYESFIKNGYNEFLTLKKKYNIKDNEMHKIGILTTYLQEYMAQFDSKNKGINNIGKRDWFKEILNNTAMKDNYSSGKPSVLKMIGIGSSEIEIIQKIWDKLPKDINGDVNPKDVYESYIANDGKFFTKNEKSFFDGVMKYKQSNITPKQKVANELSGNSFKEVPFHMLRVRLDGGKRQIQPSVSSENGTVRIKANTGKERINEKVGPVMTNFEKLFISNIEQTGRDYFLSGSLKDINNTLSGVKKLVNKDKMPLLNTISYGLSDALEFEFDRVKNNLIFKNLLSARAATALLNPIRTGVELVSSLISYPIRAKDFSGYYSLFNEQGIMKKLLEFTDSPMLLRENISKAIDINDGRIKPQSKLNKATNYLSGLPERTMMVTSWMPSFKAEFKNLTDIEFDIAKFNNNELYREKYSKAIMESAAVADAQTEKIVGTTTKAGQRREVRIAPKFLANIFGSKGTVSKNTATGQILGFFSNYPFRESTEFINGFKEAAEVLKDEGALSSLSQLQKPFGIALNIASYGFFSTASYALGLVLLGDDDDEERGNEILKELMTLDGFLSELASNAISLAGSQYAAGGKAMLQIAATIGIMSADKEEDKNKIKKLLKDSVFINPLPIEQTTKFGGKDKALAAIGMYIPQFVILADRFTETIGSAEDIKVIYDKVEKDGIKALTEDEKLKILALNTLFNATQLMLNLRGTSIPEYNKLKIYMNSIKGEGGISKEELKKSDPEMYKIMYGND